MNLQEFKSANPHLSLNFQFCPCTEDLASTVCFYNYYGTVLGEELGRVTLNLFFFNSSGEQVAYHARQLEKDEFCQISTRSLNLTHGLGTVAVACVPEKDMTKNSRKIPIRNQVPTGYYMIWSDQKNHVDTMHEWETVNFGKGGNKNSYFAQFLVSELIDNYGVVLMNPGANRGVDSFAEAELRIYGASGQNLAFLKPEPVSPMGCSLIQVGDYIRQLESKLDESRTIGIQITSANCAGPFTYEKHNSGDFHFHHL